MFKLNSAKLLAALEQMDTPVDGQRSVLTAALARALAYRLPLPTEALEGDPGVWFKEQYAQEIATLMGEGNELARLDIDEGIALTQKYWCMRYSLVHSMDQATPRGIADTAIAESPAMENLHRDNSRMSEIFKDTARADRLARLIMPALNRPKET